MINFLKIDSLSLTSKRYLLNGFLAIVVLSSIVLMFFIQFKVDNLQEKVKKIDSQILTLDDDIRVLEVEWVYLTRPERLRSLSDRYLKNNSYIAANQVKDSNVLGQHYALALRKQENVAMIKVISTQN
ncbi:MAG: cell division protein FtsL [Rickettsiales bacterium]|jgi:cell division protein FtsL